MNWNDYLYNNEEKPLDRLVDGYSNTAVFRKIAFVGDSLSSGEFETVKPDGTKGYHDLYEYSWGQYIARKNGLTAYNFSKGGMTAKAYMETFAESRGFWSTELACQAYVIALGVNDVINRGMPVGSLEDIDENDYRSNKETFTGYYSQIVSRYKEISPDAKFFFVGLPKGSRPDKEELVAKTNEAIRALAEYTENAYYIDLYTFGPVYDEKFKEKFFLRGHMNPSGYIFTAKIIDSYIDYIVRNNPDDFRCVGFINSGIDYKNGI